VQGIGRAPNSPLLAASLRGIQTLVRQPRSASGAWSTRSAIRAGRERDKTRHFFGRLTHQFWCESLADVPAVAPDRMAQSGPNSTRSFAVSCYFVVNSCRFSTRAILHHEKLPPPAGFYREGSSYVLITSHHITSHLPLASLLGAIPVSFPGRATRSPARAVPPPHEPVTVGSPSVHPAHVSETPVQ